MGRKKHRVAFLIMVAVSLFLTTVVAAPQAHAAETSDEQLFIQLMNDLRASKGMGPLQVDVELSEASRSWAREMDRLDSLQHSPTLESGLSQNWSVLGENVGVHSVEGSEGVRQLFDAFVGSPVHYDNLINPKFEFVGIGVVYSQTNGKMWTTHRFMALHKGSAPAPAPAPAPTTTPTTAAPATPAPAVQAPATPAPAVQAPATPAPAVQAPTIKQPTPTPATATSSSSAPLATTPSSAFTGQAPSPETATVSPPTTAAQATTQALASSSSVTIPSPSVDDAAANPAVETAAFEGPNRFTKTELVEMLVKGFTAAE